MGSIVAETVRQNWTVLYFRCKLTQTSEPPAAAPTLGTRAHGTTRIYRHYTWYRCTR